MKELKPFLSKIDPFRCLPAAERKRLCSIGQPVQHKKGETIYMEGERASSVWVLYQGRIEISKFDSEGKSRTMEVINPKDLFGTLCRVGGGGADYPCTAVAATDSISIRIPDPVFFNLFKKYPAMVSGVCTLCSSRLNIMRDLSCASQEPVEKRIVRALMQLSKTHGNVLPFTRREIGEMAATTVETTIRTLSRFQKKQWVSSSRGKICLKDREKLESLLN